MNFNPRTREGCDVLSPNPPSVNINFNPRTREGCDCVYVDNAQPNGVISIHAPARGAT